MRIPLASLETAIQQVRPAHEDEAELGKKLHLASGIVMDYMKLDSIPDEWLVENESPAVEVDEDDPAMVSNEDSPPIYVRVPANVQAAVLLMTSELYEKRESSVSNPISEAIVSLLVSKRDPTFA